jgi:hypothetical protein
VAGAQHQFLIDGRVYNHTDDPSHPLVEGASVSMTVRFSLNDRMSLGVHGDPRTDHIGPVVNVVALKESEKLPALVFGTSSDRIGLPHGQAYYFTLSKDLERTLRKDLERETRLRIAPYFGMSYSTYNERMRPIGGLNWTLSHGFSSIMMFDGVNVHQVVNFQRRNSVFSFILVRGKHPGFGYSVSF